MVPDILTARDALAALEAVWPSLVEECRAVLGGELHYQAVIYHCLRVAGGVPRDQIGMNVKQWLVSPITANFQARDLRKHADFRGGFETIPDITIFSPEVKADWRRRNFAVTARHALLAIEMKASERMNWRLTPGEILADIKKIAAHRDEIQHLGGEMHPVMLIVDTAPLPEERIRPASIESAAAAAQALKVSFLYLSPTMERSVFVADDVLEA